MKETAQTTKAWMQVEDVNEKLPYYRVRIALADAAEVSEVEAGNLWYLSIRTAKNFRSSQIRS